MEFDTIIRAGTIADGSGAKLYTADVGIRDEFILAIGDLSQATAARTIQAAGQIVAPGFIDIHTHSDTTLLAYPEAESRTRQGITTEVVGNCSYSPFPVTALAEKFMAPRLDRQAGGGAWLWKDLAGYKSCLQERGVGVNVAPLVGHGSIRIAAMGLENRAPSSDELNSMTTLAAESMEQGAFGFSTGLTLPPSSFADTGELIAISRAVAKAGGFYATHSRLWAGWHYRAVEEAIEIGRGAELPIQVSHQTIVDPRYYGTAAHIVEMMEKARDQGIDILYDVYPYTAGASPADQLLPSWSLEGGAPGLLARLRDSTARRRIREETAKGWFRGIPWRWDLVQIAGLPAGEYSEFVGRRITEIADELKLDPLDALLHLLDTQNDLVQIVMFNRDEDDVKYFVRHPLAMFGSDGASISARGAALQTQPHPRYYGTYPRILARYCRESKDLEMADAIRKMTGAPAARLKLRKRGLLREGYFADVVVFDPQTVADRATFDSPHRYPVGIDYVMVNGRAVVTPEGHTGELPGRVLLRE